MKIFDIDKLNKALRLLDEQLELRQHPHTELVVCGGSALIASSLAIRTTQDVSEGFRFILKEMLTLNGWEHVSNKL